MICAPPLPTSWPRPIACSDPTSISLAVTRYPYRTHLNLIDLSVSVPAREPSRSR